MISSILASTRYHSCRILTPETLRLGNFRAAQLVLAAHRDHSYSLISACIAWISNQVVISINAVSLLTDLEQAKGDVSGASNPYLADPEKSKKGEGIKDSARIHVSCNHIASRLWHFISFKAVFYQPEALTLRTILADSPSWIGHCGSAA